MGFWDSLSSGLQSLQPLAGQLQNYQDQQTMNDAFAANPAFAQALYKAKDDQQESALRGYALRSGAQSPAAIQIANELQKARASGDTQRINDLLLAAKSLDKGVVLDQNGQAVTMGGYPQVVQNISNAKQTGQNQSDLQYKPTIAGNVEQAQRNVDINTAAPIAQNTAQGTAAGTNIASDQNAISKTLPALASFDELSTASSSAPSGKIDNALAGIANTFPTISTVGTRADAVGQGQFSVKRSAAENQIRDVFKVVGSGPQTDADAKPIINMLPDPNDSEEVKQTKITAAKEALITRANEKARSRGLPLPFSDTKSDQNVQPQQPVQTNQSSSIPEGAVLIGTSGGKPIYKLPNGQGWTP